MARLIPLLVTLVAAAAMAVPAGAGTSNVSIMQDDRLFLGSKQAQALADADALGVDMIHSVVPWDYIEGTDVDQTTKPAGFDGSNPAAYPPGRWDALDDLVRGATARGIDLLLSPTPRGPVWASGCSRGRFAREAIDLRACRPDPDEWAAFVTAFARRYNGTYADENQGGGVLPRVDDISIGNEMNQGDWGRPQRTRRNGPIVVAAMYRELAYRAIDALRQNGHSDSDILIAELAPLGRSAPGSEGPAGQASSPVDFYNALFCINKRGRALRGRKARRLDCDELEDFDVEGVAHHPYRRGAFTRLLAKPRKGEISIRNINRLVRIMRFAQRRGVLPRSIPIYYTEFGVSSRPPAARGKGVSLSRQAEWLNHFEYLAYRQRIVRSVAQFQLEDDSNLLTNIFQTGIRRDDTGADLGPEKPSYDAYRLPLYVVRRGRRLEVFGLVRPHDGTETVELRYRRRRSGAFGELMDIGTNGSGYFLRRISARRGFFQIAWTDPSGEEHLSRIARVRRR